MIRALTLCAVIMVFVTSPVRAEMQGCSFNDIDLQGRVEISQYSGDLKVEIDENFPDLKVQLTEHFANDCGEWQIVEHNGDFKIQIVDNFGDITIKFVDHFPGVN